MKEFEDIVADCQKHDRNQYISNASISHAGVLVRNLFAAALRRKKNVAILTGELYAPFYDQLIEKASILLEEGIKIRVLVIKADKLSDNQFADLLLGVDSESIKVASDEDQDQMHFILVGDDAFRLETDADTMEAMANFNDPWIGGNLSIKFERCWTSAIPLGSESSNRGLVTAAPEPQSVAD